MKKVEEKNTREELLKNTSYDEDVIDAYLELAGADANIEELENSYQGKFDSNADFAQFMAEETADMPRDMNWPFYCIDWEWAAGDLMMDYEEVNGHYFRFD